MSAATATPVAEALPADALAILEAGGEYDVIGLPMACDFLGISRQAGGRKAKAYMDRVEPLKRVMETGKPYDVAKMQVKLRPLRDSETGGWLEIPCFRHGTSGPFKCKASVIVTMRYPWWRP